MSSGPEPGPEPGPDGPGAPAHRAEGSAQSYSTDAGRTHFSTSAESGLDAEASPDGPADAANAANAERPDRLAEAVALLTRIRRDGQWEASQTHESLLPYLIEESWELVDAVADGDRDELVSELGDLLLQVLFHAAIGAERSGDAFDVQDVAGALLDKLRRRAPYWFTDAGPHTDADEQDRLWQEAKDAERRAAEAAGRPPRGVVDGISWDQPALALGQKVLGRARAAGIPDELVPEELRIVHVDPVGVFHGSGSAEVSYRQVVREFADLVRAAESQLEVPAAEATAAEWVAAWPAPPRA
ncbi:MazG nucleotide pyrophosphohydrolase domain-containing protein [Dietzia aerolata]|uniref:MazG nucleotide pyrophosphohydrolase domain-containing protein n=2 Tax=Dietzia aerolata TaxID=595984 RepID=A0ABV5JPW6_9ACTN